MLGSHRHRKDPLEEWRAAARRVARAWDAWLAAERRDRRRAHAAYIEALTVEERAARRLKDRSTPLTSV